MVRCAISPDGQYIVAGSEDGKPHIWGSSLEEYFKTTAYECKLLDLVSDVVWNPRYNMFALSGFGQHFPVLVYVYQRSEDELNKQLLSGAGISADTERAADWYKDRIEKQRREQQEQDGEFVGTNDKNRYGLGDSLERANNRIY